MIIEEFITEICNILKIDIPTISYNISHFPTATTLAQCELTSNIIYINKQNRITPDYLFYVAHELHHIYQYKTNAHLYFSKYQPSNKCSSVEEYNLQIAEVDANAFASIIMVEYFSMKPQWNGLSDNVINVINKRINELILELKD